MLEVEYRKLYSEEKENFKHKEVIKNLGVEEDAWKHDGYKSPSLLIEEKDLSREPEKIHENNLFNLVKYTTFKKPLKKLIKKQLWFGSHSYHFWEEIHYKYYVKKYVSNNLPINCSDTVLIAERVKFDDKIVPFNYQKQKEWKENLASYLKMFRTSTKEEETLLIFQEHEDIENFKSELKRVDIVVIDYLDSIEDIKEIEYKNKYLYSEPKDFQKIENLWKGEMYDNAINECRNALLYFIDKYQGEYGGKSLNIKKELNPKETENNKDVFIEFLKKICADFEVKELKESLDIIIKQFGEIRNEFGKGQPKLSLEDRKGIEELYKKINARIVIDLSKIAHNLLVVLVSEKVAKKTEK